MSHGNNATRYYKGHKYGDATLLNRTGKAPLYRYHMLCDCGIEFTVARIGRAQLRCHVCKNEAKHVKVKKRQLGTLGEQIEALGRRIADYDDAIKELKELVNNL